MIKFTVEQLGNSGCKIKSEARDDIYYTPPDSDITMNELIMVAVAYTLGLDPNVVFGSGEFARDIYGKPSDLPVSVIPKF